MSYALSWTCELCRDERPFLLTQVLEEVHSVLQNVGRCYVQVISTPPELIVYNSVMFSKCVYMLVSMCERHVICQRRETFDWNVWVFCVNLSPALSWPVCSHGPRWGRPWMDQNVHDVLGISDLQGCSCRLHPGEWALLDIPEKTVQRCDAGEEQSPGRCGWVCQLWYYLRNTYPEQFSHIGLPSKPSFEFCHGSQTTRREFIYLFIYWLT